MHRHAGGNPTDASAVMAAHRLLSYMMCSTHLSIPTFMGKSTIFNVVHLAQNEANYKDLLFNKMIQSGNLHAYFRREDTALWSSY